MIRDKDMTPTQKVERNKVLDEKIKTYDDARKFMKNSGYIVGCWHANYQLYETVHQMGEDLHNLAVVLAKMTSWLCDATDIPKIHLAAKENILTRPEEPWIPLAELCCEYADKHGFSISDHALRASFDSYPEFFAGAVKTERLPGKQYRMFYVRKQKVTKALAAFTHFRNDLTRQIFVKIWSDMQKEQQRAAA